MEIMTWNVYDKSSDKAKWRIVGTGQSMDYVKNLIAVESNNFKKWDKRKEHQDAQIGFVIMEDTMTIKDTLRPTHTMAIKWYKEHILSACGTELDDFMLKKNHATLNEFFDCITDAEGPGFVNWNALKGNYDMNKR